MFYSRAFFGPHPEFRMPLELEADILVIGTGIAGLTFALEAAELGTVLLITKKERAASNTNYARGGIAAVFGEDDAPELHVRDTLKAGAGLCRRDVVEIIVREGPARVRELMNWGARFHLDEGRPSLGREGGHSRRRIVHAGDRTGREIERALLEAVAADRIRILEDVLAVDFLLGEDEDGGRACRGVVALDHRRGRRAVLRANVTMLAAGGCGQAYRHTTNPSIATGDGVAMAYRAGTRIANMEFIQFHPTALYPTEDPAFLISEALRGEGAVLRRLDGAAFMERHHAMGSLAPRDVVARAIDRELKETGDPHVILDVSPIPPDVLESRFPGAVEGCRARGVDLLGRGIPVVPAAHYVCGGVVTDTEGRTGLPGLFAAGEVACTGVHGANRLASNSLLEAVVFSHRAAGVLEQELARCASASGARWRSDAVDASGPAVASIAGTDEGRRIAEVRGRLRDLMWERVGIVRSDALLAEAEAEVEALSAAEERRWAGAVWSPEGVELRNLLQTAALVIRSARVRKESRGLHFNLDHPDTDPALARDTVVPFPEEAREETA